MLSISTSWPRCLVTFLMLPKSLKLTAPAGRSSSVSSVSSRCFSLGTYPSAAINLPVPGSKASCLASFWSSALSSRLVFFPPGDSRSTLRSHWREFLEVRDSVLAVLGRPLLPSQLLSAAPIIGPLLANPPRARPMWREAVNEILANLG